MVSEPKPSAVVNASAYAVWRALFKYELVEWKNGFLKMHSAVRFAIGSFAALCILVSAFVSLIPLLLPRLIPDESLNIEAAFATSAAAFACMFYFLFMILSSPQLNPSLSKSQILSPLPVPLSSRYAHRVSMIALSLAALYFIIGLPVFSFICMAYQANLLQAAAYAVGWASLYLFAVGICVGGGTLLSRWLGAERSAKAFSGIIALIVIASVALGAAAQFFESSSVKSVIESVRSLLPYLPSSWTVYILTDPLLALGLLPALLIVGAGGLLFGYAVFVRTFDMEAELMRVEKKEESSKRKASSRRRRVLASLLVKDCKIIVRNRKMLGNWAVLLGVWGVFLSFSLLNSTSPDMVGTIANAYMMGAFLIGLSLPILEGRAFLSVRMAMPNLRMYAVSKASLISPLFFTYALIGLAAKQKTLPALPDIAVAALIAVGHGSFIVGAICPSFVQNKWRSVCMALAYMGMYMAAIAIAFSIAPVEAQIWIAAAVCISGAVMLKYGCKRLESMDAVWRPPTAAGEETADGLMDAHQGAAAHRF